jgi:ELWxxDGT repeat protein
MPVLFGDRLFFIARDDVRSALWVTDMTAEGTAVFNDIPLANWIEVWGDRLLIETGMNEFWVSDGTTEGTLPFHQVIGPELAFNNPVLLGDRLFLTSEEEKCGSALWTSDGTDEGTYRIGGLGHWWCIDQDEYINWPTLFPGLGKLFFTTNDDRYGVELWALQITDSGLPFRRGDANADGATDISDSVASFGYLFLGDPPTIPCKESADANNDGTIDISDGIYFLEWLFLGKAEPPAPGPTKASCGFDPDPPGSQGDLGCVEYPPCQ